MESQSRIVHFSSRSVVYDVSLGLLGNRGNTTAMFTSNAHSWCHVDVMQQSSFVQPKIASHTFPATVCDASQSPMAGAPSEHSISASTPPAACMLRFSAGCRFHGGDQRSSPVSPSSKQPNCVPALASITRPVSPPMLTAPHLQTGSVLAGRYSFVFVVLDVPSAATGTQAAAPLLLQLGMMSLPFFSAAPGNNFRIRSSATFAVLTPSSMLSSTWS
mmetsp:Transcript_28639/g.72543  ORF Transcript_28639/g.72543 Transcript_28639/m.72543 type:complete len:217 (-) Transcript_28639:1199-1849(-)